jgi:adenosylhomocysteine nucleosidase
MWQSLLQTWLRQQASSRLREHVARTAQQRSGQGDEGPEQEPAPPRPCDVGLVFALGMELGGLEDLLEGVIVNRGPGFSVRQGGYQGRSIAIVESGVGREKAAQGTHALIEGHQPAWVISAGFAGALQPGMKHGDIVMADSLADAQGKRLSLDLKISSESLANRPGLHVGRLLTLDRVVYRAAEKQSLGREHDALAVDMESWAVAEVCRQEKVRLLCIRVISDTADEELPPEIGQLVQQKTTAARIGAVTGALWRRPSSAKDMLKLKENALIASDRLAKFLAGVIVQLVPPTPASSPETPSKTSAPMP